MKFRASKRNRVVEQDPIRRAELTAAAEALVEWVRERRVVWANAPHAEDATAFVDAPAHVAAVLDVPTLAVEPPPVVHVPPPIVEPAPSVHVETPIVQPAAPVYVPPAAVYAEPDMRVASEAPFETPRSPAAPPPVAASSLASPPAFEPTPPPYVETAQIASEYTGEQSVFRDDEPPAADDAFAMPVHPPANAAAQWYTAAEDDETVAMQGTIGMAADTLSAATTVDESAEAAPSLWSGLFARDSALVRWGIRGGAAAAVLGIIAFGVSRFGSHVTSSVSGLQASVSDLKSSVTDLKSSVSQMAPKGVSVLTSKGGNATAGKDAPPAGDAAGRGTAAPVNAKTGVLTIESDPAGATVTVDGKRRGVTPLTLADMAAGSHVVVLDSDKGSVRKTVRVSAGGTTDVSEGIFAGFVKVLAPYEVNVSEGNRGISLDERGQALLPPGVHELRFFNRELAYSETRRLEVEPGKTSTVSLGSGSSKLAVTASLPAEVLVDGQRVGDTPLVDQPIPLGTHEITVRSAAGERRYTTTVTAKPLRIDVDFNKR